LNQSYSSLQGIFEQSAPLSRLEASEHALSSVEYLEELGRLRVSEDSGDTFGSSQLKMWKRYVCTFCCLFSLVQQYMLGHIKYNRG
jgi:hypothetical protein